MDLIKAALDNPTTENIKDLQTFLNTNVDAITSEQKTKVDGKFGPKTDAALTAYLQEFSTFQENNVVKTPDDVPPTAVDNTVGASKPVDVVAATTVDTQPKKIEKPTIAELQEDAAFNSLPNSLQRKIKKILDLDAKDDKVDNKLADIDTKTEQINKDITTLKKQNEEN